MSDEEKDLTEDEKDPTEDEKDPSEDENDPSEDEKDMTEDEKDTTEDEKDPTENEKDFTEEDDTDEDKTFAAMETSSTSSSSSLSSCTTSSSPETESSDSETDTDSEDQGEPQNEKITLKKVKRKGGRWKLLHDKNSFRREWLDMYDWIDEHPSDSKLAICNKCFCTIKAQKSIIESHQKSKKHMRNTGELVEEEPRKEEHKTDGRSGAPFNFGGHPAGFGLDGMQYQTEDHINFFTESPADAAHQAVTSIIDKLVEKYHQNRLQNLKIQNEAVLRIELARAQAVRLASERKLDLRIQKEAYSKEAEEASLKLLQMQHEAKINAMEKEKDAKLKAVEQELVFAKQEYEKKVRLLDSQLSSMK